MSNPKYRRSEIVYVRTRALSPQLDGIYQLKSGWFRRISSNYPYAVEHNGERILLEQDEISKVGRLFDQPTQEPK